jgi:hypothetical protein
MSLVNLKVLVHATFQVVTNKDIEVRRRERIYSSSAWQLVCQLPGIGIPLRPRSALPALSCITASGLSPRNPWS